MPQLYPPSANTLVRWTLIGGGVFVVLLVTAMTYLARTTNNRVGVPVAQPVDFPHNTHVVDVGLDCRYCHSTVETSSTASVPSTETCMTCHSQIRTNTPQLQAVFESWESGQPIAWNRVHDLADYVYFDHSVHVNNGVGCSSCHGRVDQMRTAFKAEAMTMGWCLECHRDPAMQLRPRSEVFNMDYRFPSLPEVQRAIGEQLIEAYHIDTDRLIQCSTCHR